MHLSAGAALIGAIVTGAGDAILYVIEPLPRHPGSDGQ